MKDELKAPDISCTAPVSSVPPSHLLTHSHTHRPLPSVLRPLPSVLRPLPSVLRPLSSILRPLSFVLHPSSSVLTAALAFFLCCAPAVARGSRVTIDPDGALLINGAAVFPIGFTMPPPPDGRAPDGKNAIQELSDAGATFLRTGAVGGPWTDATIAKEQQWEDAAARYGLHCWVFLRELGSLDSTTGERADRLRRVILKFKDNPGLGVWKGVDEPQWGKKPIPPLLRAYHLIHTLDGNHPVALTEAPRGTVETLRPYDAAADITGADIYPVSYPPGIHSLRPNKEISMVGDYTRLMMQAADGKMPVWMILQIAWSGVTKPGHTLRFPTFPQERFMVYQAIINGARGLFFFGGSNPRAWTPEDARLGWNWSFWNRVLGPVINEIGSHSPLYPALLAPDAGLPLRAAGVNGMAGANAIEWRARRVGNDLFILACKREGPTVHVEFSGLPSDAGKGDVMFESPRTVTAAAGRFTDWFGPFEVHVYRFHLAPPTEGSHAPAR